MIKKLKKKSLETSQNESDGQTNPLIHKLRKEIEHQTGKMEQIKHQQSLMNDGVFRYNLIANLNDLNETLKKIGLVLVNMGKKEDQSEDDETEDTEEENDEDEDDEE